MKSGEPVKLLKCDGGKGQKWEFIARTMQLKSDVSGLCLDVLHAAPHKKEPVVMARCATKYFPDVRPNMSDFELADNQQFNLNPLDVFEKKGH